MKFILLAIIFIASGCDYKLNECAEYKTVKKIHEASSSPVVEFDDGFISTINHYVRVGDKICVRSKR